MGEFRVLGELQAGAGSQGAVYRAVCEGAGQTGVPAGTVVALKVMSAPDDDGSQWRRTLAHTRRMQEISSPHIVRYLGCFTLRGVFREVHVVVEEYLEGETLKERLAASPSGLDADAAISVADAMLSGLQCATEHGVVHRDVKPANVFLCRNGEVKLIDFEVARVESGGEASSTGSNIKGSFDYLSPDFLDENFRGDMLSDVFSVGVVLHEMLSGRLPYPHIEGDRRQAGFIYLARWEQAGGRNPICVSPKIDRLLIGAADVFAKALALRREDRYASFVDFRNGLRAIRFRELGQGENAYRLLRFIGKGGFGEVYKARHCASGTDVAVKRLLKMDYAKRFYREARIMQRLRDSCFVQFFDFFVLGAGAASEAFLVMAYLDGMPGNSLRDAIKSSKAAGLPMRDVFTAFSRYAHGLAVMHRQGLYHRDIKPSNLYYPQGNPSAAAIMDLGIARDENGTVTQGQVPGTLDYMPPEVVISNNRGDERMDIYALGLCLYEALTGGMGYPRLSSGSAGLTELFERARSGRLPDFSHPLVEHDVRLKRLLQEMTNPDVRRRLKDAEDLAGRLAAFCSTEPDRPVKRERTEVLTLRPKSASPAPQRSVTQRRMPVPPDFRRPAVQPEFRRSAFSYVDWRRILRKALNWGVAVSSAALVAWVCYWAFPAVKLNVAHRELDRVRVTYLTGTWEAGARVEREWLSRWRPKDGAWLELPYPSFIDCTNSLVKVKAEAQMRLEAERRKDELDRERRDCVRRLGECRRLDGRLDEERYQAVDGWKLPERLESDTEIQRILAAIGKGVAATVRAKLEHEPLADRRERLQMAKSLMANSWTGRVMSDREQRRLEAEVRAAETCVVGIVGNLCDDPILVDGVEIAPGGMQRVVVRDGKLSKVPIDRRGYRPIILPAGFDGSVFQVRNEMFVAVPVKVMMPSPGGGIICRIDGVDMTNGEMELSPGTHSCVYSREGYEDQRARFVIRVNMPVEFPPIGEWRQISGIRSKSVEEIMPAARSDEGRASEKAQDDLGGLDPRDALRISLRRRCEAKFDLEPIETRQERLDEAGTILTRAVAIDRTLSEEDARPLYAAIETRRKWAVGKVANETCDDVKVGGCRVAAGQTVLLKFEAGLPEPEKWIVERVGHLPKPLIRDFDGLTLRFRDEDFVSLNVLVSVPDVSRDITFVLDGEARFGGFYLKPGTYTGFYRRCGFRDQMVSFEVPAGGKTFTLPAPAVDGWKPK